VVEVVAAAASVLVAAVLIVVVTGAAVKKIADEAKRSCFGVEDEIPACPVRKECLWSAIESEEQHGIWGGLSHRERNALVRKWQRKYKDTMTLKEYVFQINKKEK
jgi:hypothetical protein